jgi:hypothetical protein
MGNAVVYFEIGGPDDRPLAEFYGELFGWAMQKIPGANYTLIDTRGGGGCSGGLGRSGTGEPWATFYVEVDDLQAVLDQVESRGGKTVVSVTEIPGFGAFAMFDDPDGLLVGLSRSAAPGEGVTRPPSSGEGAAVDWFEVLGSDAVRTQAFYSELFGWTVNPDEPGYGLVDTGAGRGMQGGLGAGQGAGWATVYASVPDVEATLARAEQLGGARVYGPNAVEDHMQTGALRDPAGNVLGVYHHAPH